MQVRLSGDHFDFPTVWDIVRDIRQLAAKRLEGLPEEVRDSATITVSELAENLAKYADGGEKRSPNLDLQLDGNRIRVCSRNAVDMDMRAQNVLDTIELITGHPDPTELYAQAIEASMTGAAGENKQGLFRIAAGGFRLSAQYDDNKWLTIVAERSI